MAFETSICDAKKPAVQVCLSQAGGPLIVAGFILDESWALGCSQLIDFLPEGHYG